MQLHQFSIKHFKKHKKTCAENNNLPLKKYVLLVLGEYTAAFRFPGSPFHSKLIFTGELWPISVIVHT